MSYIYEPENNKFNHRAFKEEIDDIISVWITGETVYQNNDIFNISIEDIYKYIGGKWCIENLYISEEYKKIFITHGWDTSLSQLNSAELIIRKDETVTVASDSGKINWLVREMLNGNISKSFNVPFDIAYLNATTPTHKRNKDLNYGVNDEIHCYPRGSCGKCVICERTLDDFKL